MKNSKSILLKKDPKIEFKILEHGFDLSDALTEENSGFYSFSDLQSIELIKPWFPRLSKFLRGLTWVANGGVPYFPDAESYKAAKIVFHFKDKKLGFWLTDVAMADAAKKIKSFLD